MLTDEEVEKANAEYAALPGTQPDGFSSTELSTNPDPKAWIDEQVERWKKDGMTYFRVTDDHGVLWVECWREQPKKEAPFVGWYTPERTT